MGFKLTYNYLVTDSSGLTIRVSAEEYESGLFASVDVTDDVSEFSDANRLEIIVYKTYLDVTESWLIGRALAMTYSASNTGNQLERIDFDTVLHRIMHCVSKRDPDIIDSNFN